MKASPRTLLVAACLLFLAQGLPLLQTRWVEDESLYSMPAYTLITEGRLRIPAFADPSNNELKVDLRPPGYPMVLASMFRGFGVGVTQARIPSILAAVGAILATYLLAVEVASPMVGVVAALLLATDNFLFLAGRIARPEIFCTFWNILAIALYFHSRRIGSNLLALLSGLSAGLSVMSHVNGIPAAVTLAALLLWDFRWRVWSQRRTWVLASGMLLVLLPYLMWAYSSPDHRRSFRGVYARGESRGLADKAREELKRYGDFLGMAAPRAGVPFRLPYRLHIAVLVLVSLGILFRKNRPLFWRLAVLLLPVLLWWTYLLNKNTRYFAITAPVFALAVAAAAYALPHTRTWSRAAWASCLLYGVTQVGGNLLFLYNFRNTDYRLVASRLREAIPAGSSVYGGASLWMALHDRPYFCYERTPLDYALDHLSPNYLILNDRLMVYGTRYGDDFTVLRAQANEFARHNGALVAHIPHRFYGDLDVYRVNREVARR